MTGQREKRRMFRSLRVGALAANTIHSSLGLGMRAAIQAIYLLLVSRTLGAQGYGLFAGSVAAAVLLAPLSSWGMSYLIAQRVAEDRTALRGLWATALVQVAVIGALSTAVVTATSSALMSRSVDAMLMSLLCVSELMLLPIAQVISNLFIVCGRGAFAAASIVIVPAARLLTAAIVLVLERGLSPSTLTFAHFLGSALGAAGAIALLARCEGAPSWSRRLPFRVASRQGTPYAAGAVISTSYTEIDKVLLLQIAGSFAAGTYTAAFRVISVLAMPVTALASNVLPRLFAAPSEAGRLATFRSMVTAGAAYGLVAAVIATVIAPWMPAVFGEQYGNSTSYLWMLAPWVPLYALHISFATSRTSEHRQAERIAIETSGAVVLLLVDTMLIPRIGGAGAAVGLIAAEVMMLLVFVLTTRERVPVRSDKSRI